MQRGQCLLYLIQRDKEKTTLILILGRILFLIRSFVRRFICKSFSISILVNRTKIINLKIVQKTLWRMIKGFLFMSRLILKKVNDFYQCNNIVLLSQTSLKISFTQKLLSDITEPRVIFSVLASSVDDRVKPKLQYSTAVQISFTQNLLSDITEQYTCQRARPQCRREMFRSPIGKNKKHKIGVCCFSNACAALRSKKYNG